MKKTAIFVLLSIINIGYTTAQVELKGKKLQLRLEQINLDINTGNYEHAIKLISSQDTIIVNKNVKKKELPLYLKNDSIVKSKIGIFEENKSKVLTFKAAYEAKEYEVAIQMLDLQLNRENSYLETQNIQNQLKGELTALKKQFVNLNAINSIVDNLNFSQVEPTQFDEFINNLKSAINTSDSGINRIIANYPRMKDIAEEVKETNGNKLITKINQYVSDIILNDLDYAKASKLITRIKSLNSYTKKLYGTLGNSNTYLKQSDIFEQALNDKVATLQKYRAANRPTIIEAIEFIDPTNATVASEPVVETNTKINKILLRKGLIGKKEVYYFQYRYPNGLFVNHEGVSCILEDNDSIPYNGIVKEYNEYGSQLVAEHNFVNGKLEGKQTYYSDDGQISSTYNYVNGKLEGKRIEYIDGKVFSTFNYVNDKREGKYENFFDNGDLSETCFYKNDKKEGKELSYWKDGSLKGEKNWVNGIQEGYSMDRKGDVKETYCYYLHGKRNGEYMLHLDSGEKIIYTMVNNNFDGIVKAYYLNGNIQATWISKTINGSPKRIGKMTVYDEYQNGKIDHYENPSSSD